eukprot:TRINITY_DN14061_c0_g1_i1.p1 TRINITY_DN14061_c0_g1~~TRINITY_DN14061_c0_g1_i1.p1  ORF type:complete len:725 (+),score=173.71 TRINITY_DN14061_c0_g1_i1:44-2218(+)
MPPSSAARPSQSAARQSRRHGRPTSGRTAQVQPPHAPPGTPAPPDFYACPELTTPQLEATLAKHQQELHWLVAQHYESARQMIFQRDQSSMVAQIENQELRAQIAELRKACGHTSAESKTHALKQKHYVKAHQLLLRRDQDARHAECEAQELRVKLAEKKGGERPLDFRGLHEDAAESSLDEVEDVPWSEGEYLSQQKRARPYSAKSNSTVATSQAPERPESADLKNRKIELPKSSTKGGVDLLMSLKLPGQVYEEGQFLPTEESSEESEHEPEAWSPPPKKVKSLMDMKDRMDKMFQDKYDSSIYFKRDSIFSRIALHPIFDQLSMVVIILNVLWIGVDTAINDADLLIEADPVVVAAENVFCIFFTFEFVVRLLAFEDKRYALKDRWLIFDGILVAFMVLETWMMYFIMLFGNMKVAVFDPSLIRLLRIFRISKVTRIFRILNALPELMILVKALGVASRSVVWAMGLLIIFIYLFAVICTHLAKGSLAGESYFKSLGDSMFSLFFYGVFGYDLPGVAGAAFHDNLWLALAICLFIICIPMTLLNLLVAVLCEVVGVMASAETEALMSQHVEEQLLITLAAIDTNQDGDINLEEFTGLLDKKEALLVFRELGIDVVSLVENPELIFGVNDALSFDDFVKQVLLLRESNTATVKDIHQLKRQLVDEISEAVYNMSKQAAVSEEQRQKSAKKKHAIAVTRAAGLKHLKKPGEEAAMGRVHSDSK